MKSYSNEQLFLLVVEMGSFKAVAEHIGGDPSIISRRIASLEQKLTTKLIERSTRSSTPTHAGQIYYQGLRHIIDEQNALEQYVSAHTETPIGRLRVAAPHDFGIRFVMPVLEAMTLDYPQLEVELVLGSDFADLKEQGIDVAIRIGLLPDSSLMCRKIGDVSRVLVAAPSYVQEKGLPTTYSELKNHHFILYRNSINAKNLQLMKNGQVFSQPISGTFTVNSVEAIHQLVLSGRGMHLGPRWAFADDLRAGNLIEILPDYEFPSSPLNALYVSRNYLPAKSKVFIERLKAQYQDNNEQFKGR